MLQTERGVVGLGSRYQWIKILVILIKPHKVGPVLAGAGVRIAALHEGAAHPEPAKM